MIDTVTGMDSTRLTMSVELGATGDLRQKKWQLRGLPLFQKQDIGAIRQEGD